MCGVVWDCALDLGNVTLRRLWVMLYPKRSAFCFRFCSPVDNALGWAQKASSVSGAAAQCIPAVCPVYVCGSGLSRRLGRNLDVEFGVPFLGTCSLFSSYGCPILSCLVSTAVFMPASPPANPEADSHWPSDQKSP